MTGVRSRRQRIIAAPGHLFSFLAKDALEVEFFFKANAAPCASRMNGAEVKVCGKKCWLAIAALQRPHPGSLRGGRRDFFRWSSPGAATSPKSASTIPTGWSIRR